MRESLLPGTPLVPTFAPESAAAARTALGTTPERSAPAEVTSSTDAGWRSLLLVTYEARSDEQEPFDTVATPDQALVAVLGGSIDLACFSNGRWRRAVRQAGSCGLSPGGTTDRLRWQPRDSGPTRTAHLFIPQVFFDAAREEFRRAGTRWHDAPLNALGFRDRAVVHLVLSLIDAAEAGAPDLYAQAAGQYLATHLLARYSPWPDDVAGRQNPGPLTDRRLARVLDYMSVHRGEPLTLDRLAAEAGISKFHFVRLFRAAAGETPYACLVRLRMDAARQMLRDTELTVAEVAAASGYASAAQFRAAFVRHAGCAPAAFRVRARAGPRADAAGTRPTRAR